jgi:hypothetical protein
MSFLFTPYEYTQRVGFAGFYYIVTSLHSPQTPDIWIKIKYCPVASIITNVLCSRLFREHP